MFHHPDFFFRIKRRNEHVRIIRSCFGSCFCSALAVLSEQSGCPDNLMSELSGVDCSNIWDWIVWFMRMKLNFGSGFWIFAATLGFLIRISFFSLCKPNPNSCIATGEHVLLQLVTRRSRTLRRLRHSILLQRLAFFRDIPSDATIADIYLRLRNSKFVITRAIFYWPKNLKKLTLFYQKIDFIDLTKKRNEKTSPYEKKHQSHFS